MRGVTKDLRRMRKQDCEAGGRDIRGSLLDAVNAVEMGIVNAADINPLIFSRYRYALVQQHLDSEVFQAWDQPDRVVIAEDAVYRRLQLGAYRPHALKHTIERAEGGAAKVTCQNA